MIKLLFEPLRTKHFIPSREKLREKNIMFLAIFCGILVAGFSGADFFILVSKGQFINLIDIHTFKTFVGIVLSGLFISLGSKFWHDMLDIVLQISNFKKGLLTNKINRC